VLIGCVRACVVERQTLLEFVKRKKRLTESETRKHTLQMLDGVRFLHTSKVIHRDLKLGNLFLGRDDEIKIGDFGLACKLQFDGERKRTLCGTPNYIAPEVLEGKNGHSYEVDMWSIGVVMYTCLVGKPPFETSDVKSTYKLIKANSYSFPERLHISEGAKSLVRRILQSDPEMRPSIEQVLMDPWFLGQGMSVLQHGMSSGMSSGVSAMSTGMSSDRASALPSSLSSAMGILSEKQRPPLHPIADSQQISRGASGLDRDLPSSSKYSDLVGSRAATAELSGAMALERNITSSTGSHYAGASDGPDSARGTSSALSSGSTLLRPSSASAALPSDKAGTTSGLSSLGAATSGFSSSVAADYLARRAGSGSSSNVYSTMSNNLPASTSAPERPMSAVPQAAGSTTPTKRLSQQLETMDLRRDTGAAALRKEEDRAALAARTGDGEDQLSLQSMHTNITAVLVHVPPSSSSAPKKDPPTSYLPLPSVWVSRWVDYSKKYGLGYKLSNGCSGVFFNDATKVRRLGSSCVSVRACLG
jgi:serine/threonine protein kinase